MSADIGRYGAVGDADALGVLRVNWRSSDPRFLTAVKAAVAADYSDDEVRTTLNLLEPDETLSILAADARGRAACGDASHARTSASPSISISRLPCRIA